VPKKISILGSTGSIGRNALNVIDNLPKEFEVIYLTANTNYQLLIEQALNYRPKAVCITDITHAKEVETRLKQYNIDVFTDQEGLVEISKRTDIDIVLNAIVGIAGMEPTLNVIGAGIDLALSNKESLIMAGQIVRTAQDKSGSSIYPVDSEHSAIWQCLQGENKEDVSKLVLTGSGGPFRIRNIHTFSEIKPEEALKHPNWNMGSKITIDSATMMNKGLEIIEAYWLFDFSINNIDIIIHPQSIIHSMIELQDGSVKAQLGVPDMKVPIQYALTYPRHMPSDWARLDLVKLGQLTFEAPDYERFPSIKLAYNSLIKLGTMPAVLNVANEYAVYRFLNNEIKFTDIPIIVEQACSKHDWIESPTLSDLQNLIEWSKEYVNSYN
jgi:1-deoxy-D-xylulose-5-phosphate reductoisomerase